MKVLILLAIIVVVRGTAIPFALEESRTSAQFRSEDNLGNYNYGYYEYPSLGETFRRSAGYAYKNAGPYRLTSSSKTFADPSTKSTTTITTSEAKPFTYAFPEPAAAVAKTHTTVTESKPVAYAFPAPAAIPVAKSHTTVTESKPVAYAFPAPAAIPVAKSHTTITETKPISYAFPAPAAIPIAKSSAIITTAETKPVAYAFPAPAAFPVAKSIAAPAPLPYAFPAPAAIPIAKSSALTYAAAPFAYAAPASKVSYSSQVINDPAPVAIAPSTIAFAPRYALNPYFSSALFYRPL